MRRAGVCSLMRNLMLALTALLLACVPARGGDEAPTAPPAAEPSPSAPSPDAFDELLRVDAPVTDGFSSPVGEGWKVYDLEDQPCVYYEGLCEPIEPPWCSISASCWERKEPAVVRAPAAGVVVERSERHITIRTQYYENHERRIISTALIGLTPAVALGATVSRGQPLGSSNRLSVYANVRPMTLPAAFFATHPSTPVPQAEPTLVLIQHDSYTMRIYKNGSLSGTYNVSFGQEAGVKERRGDNRTPKGVYYVIARSLGPFDGPYGEYYGGHWIKLNYPNAYDAARGVDQGLITPAQQVSISRAWRARQPTLGDTALGGGIGLHGWAREWEDDGPRHLSWGCVVLHLEDVGEIYDSIPQSATVILF